MTDSGTKLAWVIHESKAVQIHVQNNRLCLCVSLVPGSIKNQHNKNAGIDYVDIGSYYAPTCQRPGAYSILPCYVRMLRLFRFTFKFTLTFMTTFL